MKFMSNAVTKRDREMDSILTELCRNSSFLLCKKIKFSFVEQDRYPSNLLVTFVIDEFVISVNIT